MRSNVPLTMSQDITARLPSLSAQPCDVLDILFERNMDQLVSRTLRFQCYQSTLSGLNVLIALCFSCQ